MWSCTHILQLLIHLVKKWNDANHGQIDSYRSILDDKLSIIDIPYDCINCTNVFCNNNEHAALIQHIMHDDIISACIDASDNIPITKINRKNLPGWNEFVSLRKKRHFFGAVFGLTMVLLGKVKWLIL